MQSALERLRNRDLILTVSLLATGLFVCAGVAVAYDGPFELFPLAIGLVMVAAAPVCQGRRARPFLAGPVRRGIVTTVGYRLASVAAGMGRCRGLGSDRKPRREPVPDEKH